MYENPESDVTEILTRGGFAPSETSSRTLTVVSVYSKDRIAINAEGKIVSFSATNTFVSSEIKKQNFLKNELERAARYVADQASFGSIC